MFRDVYAAEPSFRDCRSPMCCDAVMLEALGVTVWSATRQIKDGECWAQVLNIESNLYFFDTLLHDFIERSILSIPGIS